MNSAEIADTLTEAGARAFRETTAARARPVDTLSISALGRCRRQAAYRLAGTPPTDTPPPAQGRAANLGTWEHDGFLPALARALDPDGVNSTSVEHPVVLRAAGIEITGHADLVWADVVVDLKTVGEHRLAGVDVTPYVDHLTQVTGYALACRQAGMEINHVAWYYMDRASGDERIHVQPFSIPRSLAVVDRVREIVELAGRPDTAPRDDRGPGLSRGCDECPWLRRCWGTDARPGMLGGQRTVAHNAKAVAAALRLYADARTRRKESESDMAWAREVFTQGSAPGTYGDLRWWRSSDGSEIDTAAAVALLEEHGIEVPYRTRTGALQVRTARKDHDRGNA